MLASFLTFSNNRHWTIHDVADQFASLSMIRNAILCNLSKTGLSELWGYGAAMAPPDFWYRSYVTLFRWGGGHIMPPEFTNLPMTDLGNRWRFELKWITMGWNIFWSFILIFIYQICYHKIFFPISHISLIVWFFHKNV